MAVADGKQPAPIQQLSAHPLQKWHETYQRELIAVCTLARQFMHLLKSSNSLAWSADSVEADTDLTRKRLPGRGSDSPIPLGRRETVRFRDRFRDP